MLFVCHPKILHKLSFQFLLGVKMALRETENNAFARFLGTNKEHYGMLWIFWSGQLKTLFSSLEVMSRAVHDICRPQIADYK